jgi:hypothetical protein
MSNQIKTGAIYALKTDRSRLYKPLRIIRKVLGKQTIMVECYSYRDKGIKLVLAEVLVEA